MTHKGLGSFKCKKNAFQLLKKLAESKAKGIVPVLMQQTHSARIFQITENNYAGEIIIPDGDGIYLKNSLKISLGLRLADCMGVIAFNKDRLLGVFHAGWRGVLKGIGSCFVRKATADGISPKDLEFRVGPHICQNCYKVGKEVWEKFPPEAVNNGRVNLFKALKIQLLHSGVETDKIVRAQNIPACTYEKPCYFSHRRGDEERMLMFAMQC